MEHIIELGEIVTGFNVTEQCIDCMCGKNLIKIDKHSRNIICQKTVFEKELVLEKKNIGSLYIDGETLYAASHDGKLFKISMIMYISSRNILGIDKIKLNE